VAKRLKHPNSIRPKPPKRFPISRVPNYLAFAFHEEWRSRRDHYQPVFEETFSLRQVYVPLRAYWREEAKVRKPRPKDQIPPEDQIHVVDLREAIEDWFKSAEHDDAIRVVSGGRGSGKSSFAKKLAADLCEISQMRVLFFPLQRFPTNRALQEAMRAFLLDSGAFAESPIRQANFASKVNPLLLIFDGLDELTKPGDLADKMTREFVQEVRTNLGIWNAQERRVLVLITGRTIVAQQHRQSLGLSEAQSLRVLPYLLEEADKEELARMEKAQIHDERQRLEDDQSREWWRNYSKAKDKPDAPFPRIFDDSKDIKGLTKDPLLNYLVVLSRFHETQSTHPGTETKSMRGCSGTCWTGAMPSAIQRSALLCSPAWMTLRTGRYLSACSRPSRRPLGTATDGLQRWTRLLPYALMI
jgi:adenylate kinase family enzyme